MSPPTCAQLRLALGVYVLGSIDPAERLAVDRHLGECDSCRDEVASLAGIPGLLGRLAEPEVAALTDRPALDGALLDRILTSAAAGQRAVARRRRYLATAAAVVLLATGVGAGATVVANRNPAAPASRPAVRLSSTAGAVTASAALTGKAWGTSVDLRLAGVPAGRVCRALAVSRSGTADAAASWKVTAAGRANVTGATALQLADLAAVRIVDTDGRTLITMSR